MDFRQIATEVTLILTPFLPYLILTGEAAAKEIGEKFGEVTIEKAKLLWNKIKSSSEDNIKLQGVATALAEDPDDQDFQVALTKLLVKQLEAHPKLANDLLDILKNDQAIQKVLIGQESKAKNILQRMSVSGTQEVKVVGNSEVDNIRQEM